MPFVAFTTLNGCLRDVGPTAQACSCICEERFELARWPGFLAGGAGERRQWQSWLVPLSTLYNHELHYFSCLVSNSIVFCSFKPFSVESLGPFLLSFFFSCQLKPCAPNCPCDWYNFICRVVRTLTGKCVRLIFINIKSCALKMSAFGKCFKWASLKAWKLAQLRTRVHSPFNFCAVDIHNDRLNRKIANCELEWRVWHIVRFAGYKWKGDLWLSQN